MKHNRKNKNDRKFSRLTGSKRIDHSCRNNGSCSYCRNNRRFRNRRQEANNDFEELKPGYRKELENETKTEDSDWDDYCLKSLELDYNYLEELYAATYGCYEDV